MSDSQAIIFPLGGYVPIKEIEVVDEGQKIYKGKIVDHPNQQLQTKDVFFSRDYKPEVNELDQIFVEKHFDSSLIGVPFTLVPKEKLLFGFFPKSVIQLPDPSLLGVARRRTQ